MRSHAHTDEMRNEADTGQWTRFANQLFAYISKIIFIRGPVWHWLIDITRSFMVNKLHFAKGCKIF